MRLAAMSLLCVFPAFQPAFAMEPAGTCHANGRYSVLEVENDDAPGARFLVSAAGDSGACGFDESGAAQIIGDGIDPLWFSDLVGRFLLLTRSTGPQGDLVVYDLESGAGVLDVPSDDFEAHEGGITFWQRVTEAKADTCPEFAQYTADGFGAVIVERAHFDFGSGSVERAGEQRCVPVQ